MAAFEWDLGDGLVLRLAEVRFAGPYAELVAANRAWLDRWGDWSRHQDTHDLAEKVFTKLLHGFAEGTRLPLLIVDRGTLAGHVDLRIDPDHRSATVGYWIGERFTGTGLATRAVDTITGHALTDLHLVRVEARLAVGNAVGNAASRAVVRRAGFELDGTLRSAYQISGVPHDLEVWSRLATDPGGPVR